MNKKEMDKKKEIQNMERDERFVKRIQLKEAAEDEKEDTSISKKPRLDLLNLLNPTASVLDILAASGWKPLPTLSFEDQINKETDTGNRPGVLDIFEPLPMDAPAEDKEAVEVAMEAPLEEALLETLNEDAATAEEIITIATTGAEEASSESFPVADQCFPSLEADAQAPLAAMDDIPNSRSRRVYLSPALVWLEEEGLPTAEREVKAMEKAIGVGMVEEEEMRAALLKWKMMGSKEKAVWRKRAEEKANKKL